MTYGKWTDYDSLLDESYRDLVEAEDEREELSWEEEMNLEWHKDKMREYSPPSRPVYRRSTWGW